jgi:hypothetical protein
MRRSLHLLLIAVLALGLLSAPAGAHDPDEGEGHDHGDHTHPGEPGPDRHSKNVKLLSNLPKPAGTTTQSDLAFFGKHAVVAHYQGFRIVDTSDPEAPVTVTDVRCNGAQSDVSVYRHLVFQSVDSPQNHGGCDSSAAGITAATPGMFEGVRVFDISDIRMPRHVASISTDCGSHTHTLYPDPANGRVVVYVSSYPLGNAALGPRCRAAEEGDGHGRVSAISVPLANPAGATVTPASLDAETPLAVYPLQGRTFSFTACHDISVFVELKLAAGACMSEAQLWSLEDPLNPRLLWRFDHPVVDTRNIDLWHSATFSWDGKVVAFGDESGGGGAARCTDPDDLQGRIWFLDTATGELLANFKVPRPETGICTMHNFNFLPLAKGRKVLVSSAYNAGTSVIDVDRLIATQDEAASEIGFYKASRANTWSSYWYNGHIYANDIVRGLDIFLLSDNARAGARKLPYLNPQTQESVIR